jgi:hypothetical protein
MALDLPQWAQKTIDNPAELFLERAQGGKRGALSYCMGWALRSHWLWLKKKEPHHLWVSLEVRVPDQVRAFFTIAINSEVGNGQDTMFWTDR